MRMKKTETLRKEKGPLTDQKDDYGEIVGLTRKGRDTNMMASRVVHSNGVKSELYSFLYFLGVKNQTRSVSNLISWAATLLAPLWER